MLRAEEQALNFQLTSVVVRATGWVERKYETKKSELL